MKYTWRTELLPLSILMLIWALSLAWWPGTPERIPVHWGLDGHPDAWGGRATGLLLMPAVATALYLLVSLVPLIDPGRANYESFSGVVLTARLAGVALIAALHVAILVTYRGVTLDLMAFAFPLIGVLLIVVGNLMGKLRPNWFFGVRTPWTLSSKKSWTMTHRLAGWVMIGAGLVFLGVGVVRNSWTVGIAFAALWTGVLAVVVYSYFVWRSDPDKVPPSGSTVAKES